MNEDFKIIVVPGNLNNTPHGEDLVLVVTLEEFLRMWKRGEAMLRNRMKRGVSRDAAIRECLNVS